MTKLVCRALLRLYPRTFRERFGTEMCTTLELRAARAREVGIWNWMRLCARECLDVLVGAVREWRSVLTDESPQTARAVPPSGGRDSIFVTLVRDTRYAFRSLGRSPGFAAIVVFTLGLGIAANVSIFTVVNAVLLTPLPYDDPQELVMVWESKLARDRDRNVVNPANFTDWREQNESFADLALFYRWSAILTGGGDPERVATTTAHPAFFAVLGATPLAGRTFIPEDGEVGQNRVVLLSYGFWQRRFGGKEDLIGTSLTLDGIPFEVIGILPASFDFPGGTDVWYPTALGSGWRSRAGRFAMVVGRLRAGVDVQQAQVEMDQIARRLEQEYPDFNTGWGARVVGLRDEIAGDVRPALIVLLAAVALVLLIACVNVANLLLGRAAARAREVAIRSALGAGRARIVQQLLTESALLTLIATGLGVALAIGAVNALVILGPGNLPRLEEVAIDGRLLAFTLVLSVATGLTFGVLPALHASRTDVQTTLRDGGRTAGSGPVLHRLRSALVVVEMALALMLLVGAGLLIRSFEALTDVELGLAPDHVLSASISLPNAKYQDRERQVGFFDDLLERIRAVPGVVSASAISSLPLAGPGAATSFTADDRPPPAVGDEPVADVRAIQTDYFRTMGIALRRGRTFDGTERADATVLPVLINEWMARDLWPGDDPLGKRITMPWDGIMHGEVIGVVDNVRHQGLDVEPRSMIYWAQSQFPYSFMYVVVRAQSDPAGLVPLVRQQVWAIDPEIPLSDVRAMAERLGASVAQRRFNTLLLGVFAAVAVLLSAVGIYGVMAYHVSQRAREMGLRMALGAERGAVIKLIVGQGMMLSGIAVGIGLVGALVTARVMSGFMSGLLFGVGSSDPVTLIAVVLTLSAVALFACYLPARRATKIDPIEALRVE